MKGYCALTPVAINSHGHFIPDLQLLSSVRASSQHGNQDNPATERATTGLVIQQNHTACILQPDHSLAYFSHHFQRQAPRSAPTPTISSTTIIRRISVIRSSSITPMATSPSLSTTWHQIRYPTRPNLDRFSSSFSRRREPICIIKGPRRGCFRHCSSTK